MSQRTVPSCEDPQLWCTTLAGSQEVQRTVKLSQGPHVDGIIGVPVTTPLRELTAVTDSRGSRDSGAAKPDSKEDAHHQDPEDC